MRLGLELPAPAKPYKTNPPQGTVGIVLPIRDDLPFFKLAFHSIRSFTDYRHMLTIVDNMCSFSTRNYLTGVQRNHTVNVIQYQKDNDLEGIWRAGFNFMLPYASVKYGLALTPNIIVEPLWLAALVRALQNSKAEAVVPESNTDTAQCILFHREAYERMGHVGALQKITTPSVYVHKFKLNGFDPRESEGAILPVDIPEKEEAKA